MHEQGKLFSEKVDVCVMAFAVVESQSIQNTAPRRIYFKSFGLFRGEHFARERERGTHTIE